MPHLTSEEKMRLLEELCAIPRSFLEKMDEPMIRKLFSQRLGGGEQRFRERKKLYFS